jgi:hypothetical protein
MLDASELMFRAERMAARDFETEGPVADLYRKDEVADRSNETPSACQSPFHFKTVAR